MLWSPFWTRLAHECDKRMARFETCDEHSMNEEYSKFRQLLQAALAESIKKDNPLITTLGARLKTNQDIVALQIRRNLLFRT